MLVLLVVALISILSNEYTMTHDVDHYDTLMIINHPCLSPRRTSGVV